MSGKKELKAGQHNVTTLHAVSSPAIIEKFVIRLPQGLREQIKEVSEHNRRSMNAEIVRVLEQYIHEQQTVAHENPEDLTNGTTGAVPNTRATSEEELNRRLESLPADKKNALLSLLT